MLAVSIVGLLLKMAFGSRLSTCSRGEAGNYHAALKVRGHGKCPHGYAKARSVAMRMMAIAILAMSAVAYGDTVASPYGSVAALNPGGTTLLSTMMAWSFCGKR